MKRFTLLLVLGLIGLSAVGCSRKIVEAENPAAFEADLYKTYFDATVGVLRDNGFVIDRRDYRFGTITTAPLGSPNIFEVWRPQNTTGAQAVESTLADEQRVVTVQFSGLGEDRGSEARPADAPFSIAVKVMLERKQVPTRRLTGSATRNVFSTLAATPRELADKGVTGTYWEPIGRDAYLESRLMKQIQERVLGEESFATDEHR